MAKLPPRLQIGMIPSELEGRLKGYGREIAAGRIGTAWVSAEVQRFVAELGLRGIDRDRRRDAMMHIVFAEAHRLAEGTKS